MNTSLPFQQETRLGLNSKRSDTAHAPDPDMHSPWHSIWACEADIYAGFSPPKAASAADCRLLQAR